MAPLRYNTNFINGPGKTASLPGVLLVRSHTVLAIIDYEAGNLTSVERAVRLFGAECRISNDPQVVAGADRVIFPGVGAAGATMGHLKRLGLDAALVDAVAVGKPTLGICIGCQVVMDQSEEDDTRCLGLIPGVVKRFPLDFRDQGGGHLKVPHMGWNGIRFSKTHPVLDDLPEGAEFYFVHSYYPVPAQGDHCLGWCDYGMDFCAAMAKDSLVALQFHAEKSGRPGLKIIENFLKWDGKEGAGAV